MRYVSTNSSDIAGVIASAPLIGLGSAAVLPFPFMEIQRFAVINLSYLLPNFTILNPVKSRDLSRDPKVCAEYDLDPHNHPYVSFGTINDVVIGGEKLVPSDVKIPILVSHGSCDNLTSCDASKKFVDECSVADKEHWLLDGYYHELHNDLGNDLVIDKYVNWILQRAKK